MYKLPYFTEEDKEKVIGFMKEHPFALITGFGEIYPVATHIPLLIETTATGQLLFRGHLMRKTDHHRAFEKQENVLVVFSGPNSYVSASWYPEPAVGSTWNYIAVHAKGRIRFLDEAGTIEAVKAITNKQEGHHSTASFHNLSHEYIAKLVPAIVGFTIEVDSFDNVFKLSQNHHEDTRKNIERELVQTGDQQSGAIAAEMQKTTSSPNH